MPSSNNDNVVDNIVELSLKEFQIRTNAANDGAPIMDINMVIWGQSHIKY